jgi:hypothetical protein
MIEQPSNPQYRWTSLVGAALRLHLAGRVRRLSDERHWRQNAAGIQLAQLRRLLADASGTWFGKAHGFEKLATLPQAELLTAYRKAVPVADWYAYKDAIARMREGAEPDVLWPGLVRDFAQTSGTTAGDKFIPVSRAMLRSNYLASLDIFANLARFGVSLPPLLAGKSPLPWRLDRPLDQRRAASAPAISPASSRHSSAGPSAASISPGRKSRS